MQLMPDQPAPEPASKGSPAFGVAETYNPDGNHENHNWYRHQSFLSACDTLAYRERVQGYSGRAAPAIPGAAPRLSLRWPNRRCS